MVRFLNLSKNRYRFFSLARCNNAILHIILLANCLSNVFTLPQQIFIPDLEFIDPSDTNPNSNQIMQRNEANHNLPASSSSSSPYSQPIIEEQSLKEVHSYEHVLDSSEPPAHIATNARINMLPYNFNEDQLNDLFSIFQSSSNNNNNNQNNQNANPYAQNFDYFNSYEHTNNNDMLNENNNYKFQTTTPITTTSTITTTTTRTTTSTTTTTKRTTTTSSTASPTKRVVFMENTSSQSKEIKLLGSTFGKLFDTQQQMQRQQQPFNIRQKAPLSFSNEIVNFNTNTQKTVHYKCKFNKDLREPDDLYCNMYHMCTLDGELKTLLCPDGYLYSLDTLKCEKKQLVKCGKRLELEFDRTNVQYTDLMNNLYQMAPKPRIINGSLECSLGVDGYFADPEFCNIYHHCLAGIDYPEQCPHQLVWNDRKKMCDWQTSVNCTGRVIPVAAGEKSFCTDKADNKYADATYCNVFHHCVGGIDNVVRCDGELQWNDQDKKCDWESKVKCARKMLPSEKHYNSTFCIGKPDGPYAHEEYCNVYHVCESGTDNIRQCPNQLFWDARQKKCDWSGNVQCTGRTLVTLSTDTTLFCMERRDGVYGDPTWCNVYHNCLSGVDFKTKCGDGLVWNETKKDCDWSDSTQCSTGQLLQDSTDNLKDTFCSNKLNGKYAHELHCNRYYVCQNGKDIIFTCQNNLRYNETKQECDWAVNVNCMGKQDYMWEGIKDNFCKNKPDGNYADPVYCNIFHQCQAAMDYPKKCSNRLMFNEEKGECDWEDQVECKGREKLIETSGLQDESKPSISGDGKGRVTKFCMTRENGNYADLFYCNVYHNCHGGFDTVQYCSNGLVWRQDTAVSGTCDWPLSSKIKDGVDCGSKKVFMIDKQSQVDIMASLRSDFCVPRGEGLFGHSKYCDLYIQCTAQAVAITMECSPGLIFNEAKHECDYVAEELIAVNTSYCPPPKQILRPKPKADGTLMFNGNDVTGKFPTKFVCDVKSQQIMYKDDDWCNIYHVCAGPRDNIFICPPGTVFNHQKQGCFDRYSQNVCVGSSQYYKPNIPSIKKPVQQNQLANSNTNSYNTNNNNYNYNTNVNNNNNNNNNHLPIPTTTANANDFFYPFNNQNFNYNQNLNNFN